MGAGSAGAVKPDLVLITEVWGESDATLIPGEQAVAAYFADPLGPLIGLREIPTLPNGPVEPTTQPKAGAAGSGETPHALEFQ